MLALYRDDARQPPALPIDVREIAKFRQQLEDSLERIAVDDFDLVERTQLAIAALHRLEWVLRADGQTSVSVPSGRESR